MAVESISSAAIERLARRGGGIKACRVIEAASGLICSLFHLRVSLQGQIPKKKE